MLELLREIVCQQLLNQAVYQKVILCIIRDQFASVAF